MEFKSGAWVFWACVHLFGLAMFACTLGLSFKIRRYHREISVQMEQFGKGQKFA